MQFGNGPTYGSQSGVSAMEVAFSIYTSVDSAFYDVEYPEHDYYKVLNENQIQRNISAGAINYAYISRDYQGRAAFAAQIMGDNVPLVGQSAGAVTVPLAVSMVGAKVTNEDARQYSQGFNANLAQDLGKVMQKAIDNLNEVAFFFGESTVGYLPWLDYPNVAKTTAAATGTGNATTWASKTAQQMVTDVQTAITTQWTNTRGKFILGTVFLPLSQYSLLASTPMVLNSSVLAQTAMAYLKANNIFTERTGKELEIIPIRYLAGAGVGPTDRMILADRRPEYQTMPYPLAPTILQPVPQPAAALFITEQKTGSFHCRYIQSLYYVDGI